MAHSPVNDVIHDEIGFHTDTEITADTEDILLTIQSYEGNKAVRFASGVCGYYVVFLSEERVYKVIRSGPHGPETRVLDIREAELEKLARESDVITEVDIRDSPFRGKSL